MKKKKETVQKVKEFASLPFGALKEVRAEPAAGLPQEQAPMQQSGEQENDDDLFLRAMAGVKPVQPSPVPTALGGKPAIRPAAVVSDEERRVFLDALNNLRLDVSFRDEVPGEGEPVRPLPVNRLRELKRGAIRIDFQLDLHGLTKDEALASLTAFIAGAWQRGQKAVLIITGKGNRSPGEPVLQGAVTGWLRKKGKGMVAEFAPAPRDMGGGGAFVVFLKSREQGAAAGGSWL